MNITDNNYDDLRQRLAEIFFQDNDSMEAGCGCGGSCGCQTSGEKEMDSGGCDCTDEGCNCEN